MKSSRRRHVRRGRHSSTLLIVAGFGIVLAAIGWSVNAWVFNAHSAQVGKVLLKQQAKKQSLAARNPSVCTGTSMVTSGGVLDAPSIGLVAPVEQGLSDAVLAVAVGHDPASVWPGSRGTAVLSAHDVSYFVNTQQLQVGDLVEYRTPCELLDFRVTGHRVVAAGSPVINSGSPSLVLVTCWPTNALWFTPNRLLVSAVLAKVTSIGRHAHANASPVVTTSYQVPLVNVPAVLVAQGLSLQTNSIPMGTLTIAGSPSKSYVESPDPLNVEQAAIEAFVAGVKAMAVDQVSWWSQFAPSVQAPRPLIRTSLSYLNALDVRITVTGGAPRTVELRTSVRASGGLAPGSYSMDVRDVLSGGQLRVSSWQMAAS